MQIGTFKEGNIDLDPWQLLKLIALILIQAGLVGFVIFFTLMLLGGIIGAV